jgi:hypothetical protein
MKFLTNVNAGLLAMVALDAQAKPVHRLINRQGTIVDFEPMSHRKLGERVATWQGKKVGFADGNGKIVIKPIYDDYTLFYDELVFVQFGDRWLAIDKNGGQKFSLPKGIKPTRSLQHLSLTKTTAIAAQRTSDLMEGVFSFKTRMFVPVGKSANIGEFSEGLASFSDEQFKCGYVDTNGKTVIKPQFREADQFSDGVALVTDGDYAWHYIDKTGGAAVKIPSDCSRAGRFSEGLAAVALGGEPAKPFYTWTRPGARWAFIDKTGKVVIPPSFYAANDVIPEFHEGLASVAVGTNADHKFGYIDKHGNWIVSPQFRDGEPFDKGFALVSFGTNGFSKQEWLTPQAEGGILRHEQFDLFLARYKLIGMRKEDVEQHLGKAEGSVEPGGVWCYTLSMNGCILGFSGVQIHFTKGGIVDKYRYGNYDRVDKWIQ